ncbi:MAG: hypothetical protein R3195_12355 [Gemmatimonadota bacterium]|nr:hypothetical protein [Gemmatimonadota bacterium]
MINIERARSPYSRGLATARPARVSAVVVAAGLLAAAAPLGAQDAPVVTPGDPVLRPDRLRPFEAEYDQLGFTFLARLVRVTAPEPTIDFLMIMEGPNGIGVDHVGHRASDLSFAYRRFGFSAFGPEHIDARVIDGILRLGRLPLEADGRTAVIDEEFPLAGPAVDGTFAYWLTAALPLEEGYRWRWPTWQPASDGVVFRESAPFEVAGRETVELRSGEILDAWVVEAVGEGSTARMWVSEEPPYLLRQDVAPAGGEPQTVIELRRLPGRR